MKPTSRTNKTIKTTLALALTAAMAFSSATACANKGDANDKSSKKKAKDTDPQELVIEFETDAVPETVQTQSQAVAETTAAPTEPERINFVLDPSMTISQEAWQNYVTANYSQVDLSTELVNVDFAYADIIDGEVYVPIVSKKVFSADQIKPGAQVDIGYDRVVTVGNEFSVRFEGYVSRQFSGYGTDDFAPQGTVVTKDDINDKHWFEYDEQAGGYVLVGYISDDDVGFFMEQEMKYYAILPVATDCEIYFCYGQERSSFTDFNGNSAMETPDSHGVYQFVPVYDDYSTCRQFAIYVKNMGFQLYDMMDFNGQAKGEIWQASGEYSNDLFNNVLSCFMYVENGTVTKIFYYYLPCGAPSFSWAAQVLGSAGNGTYYCEPQ